MVSTFSLFFDLIEGKADEEGDAEKRVKPWRSAKYRRSDGDDVGGGAGMHET